MTIVEEGLKQHAEFLNNWPISRLKTMTLEEYTNDNKSDAFIYWLEFKLNKIGGIGGGSANKFGIYRRRNSCEERMALLAGFLCVPGKKRRSRVSI